MALLSVGLLPLDLDSILHKHYLPDFWPIEVYNTTNLRQCFGVEIGDPLLLHLTNSSCFLNDQLLNPLVAK
jgi:hypothetical protein